MKCLIPLDSCILTYKSRLPVAPQLFLLEGGPFPFLSVVNASLTSPVGLQIVIISLGREGLVETKKRVFGNRRLLEHVS